MTEPATIVEFSSARRKKSLEKTSRKFSIVGFCGMYCTGVLKSSLSVVNAERSAQ